MDNLPAHRVKDVEEAVRAVAAQVKYLPPYSPDFDPIEPNWSEAKSVLRSLAALTFRRLVWTIGHSLEKVTPEACRRNSSSVRLGCSCAT